MLFLSLSRITIDMYSLFQQEFLSFTNNLMALQWEDQDLQSQQKFICRLISMLQYLWYYTLLTFRNDLLITLYSILKCKDLEKVFHHINNLHQNVALATEEKINRKLGFLDNLLKQNNRNIYLHCSLHHQTSCKESFVSFLFNRAYSIITNKGDFTKGNARIKQVSNENGHQESIISKIFQRITKKESFSQSQRKTQATHISKRNRSE